MIVFKTAWTSCILCSSLPHKWMYWGTKLNMPIIFSWWILNTIREIFNNYCLWQLMFLKPCILPNLKKKLPLEKPKLLNNFVSLFISTFHPLKSCLVIIKAVLESQRLLHERNRPSISSSLYSILLICKILKIFVQRLCPIAGVWMCILLFFLIPFA